MRHSARKKIGFLLSGFCIPILILNFFYGRVSNDLLQNSIKIVTPLCLFVILLLTGLFEHPVSYWGQTVSLALASLVTILLGGEQQFMAIPLLIITFGMAVQYRLIRFNRSWFVIISLVVTPFFILGGVLNNKVSLSFSTIAFFLVAILMIN